jgi:hypothetical protein
MTTANKRFKGIGSITPEPRQATSAAKALPAAQPGQYEMIIRDAHGRVAAAYSQLPALSAYLRNNVVGLFELARKSGVSALTATAMQIPLLEQMVDDLCVKQSPLQSIEKAVSAWEKTLTDFLTSLEAVISKPQQGGLF